MFRKITVLLLILITVLCFPLTALAESYPALNPNLIDLTKKVDELFGMRVVGGDTKTGSLYTVRGYGDNWVKGAPQGIQTWHEDYPTMNGVLNNPDIQKFISEHKAELRAIGAQSFSDIPADGSYYGEYLALPVYYGVINGMTENGQQVFKPQKAVSAQEVAVILAKSIYTPDKIDTMKEMNIYNKLTKSGIADWAATSYAKMSGGLPPYAYIGGNQSARYSAPMPRAMVAYAIADIYWRDEITKGGKYYEMAKSANNSPFSDIKKVVSTDAMATGTTADYYAKLEAAFKNPNNGVPDDYYAAMLCLNAKGIMMGDANKNSMWSEGVKRCDMLILLQKAIAYSGTEMK